MTVELRFIPCVEFEESIHAYVDQELPTADSRDLLVHMELCEGCRDAVEMVRQQIRAHRDCLEMEQLAASFDQHAFFKKLNGELLTGNLDRLAELMYELGKAYFLAGNDSKIAVFVAKKAVSIERTRGEGRRLVRETNSLAERSAAGGGRKAKQNLRRSDQLLRGRRSGRTASARAASGRSGRTALDNARRFLEECLVLCPDHARARCYLGSYFQRIHRPEDAIREFRKIMLIKDLDPHVKASALSALASVHVYRLEYELAVECYEQVLDEHLADDNPIVFTIHVGLAMAYAKLGQLERSAEVFGVLVDRFPQKLEEARTTLEQAEVFKNLLSRRSQFRTKLVERYPMLFAG